jgi:hypothetical protein
VLVFGAIGVGFKSQIIRCPKGVNSAEYVGMVLSHGPPERANELFGPENWHFMQDGAAVTMRRRLGRGFSNA